MIEKDKESGKIEVIKSQTGIFSKILVIILLMIVGIYLFYQNQWPSISGAKKHEAVPHIVELNDEENVTQNHPQVARDDQNIKEEVDSSYTFGPEPPLLSFGPKIEDIDDNEDSEVESNPYEEAIDQEKEAKICTKNEDNSKKYISYIANFNKLLIKFIRDDSYIDELEIIKQRKFPDELKEVLQMLEQYNKLLEPNIKEGKKISLFESKIFDKLIKITKNDFRLQTAELHKKIKNEISALMDYIYSSEMQEQFAE